MGLAVGDLAIHFQRAGAALTQARPAVLPVEFQRVLARRERALALPLHLFELNKFQVKTGTPLNR